jgi:deoxyribonuclease V
MRPLHDWDISFSDAIKLQKVLAQRVQLRRIGKKLKLIAGIDCAFTTDKKRIIGCVVVLSYPQMDIAEIKYAARKVTFPYVPGLLSFREAPVCLDAVKKLEHKPDLFMIDGQGVAHPRRLGLAAHLGLFFNKPTIGCAKSRLTGTYEMPAGAKGSYSYLYDGEEVIGAVVRTRSKVKPVFVSVGNKCTLEDAINLALGCATRYRIPEPTRLADIEVAKVKLRL